MPSGNPKFQFTVRAKRANVEFKEGLGIGVLSTVEIEFKLKPGQKLNKAILAARLYEEADKQMREEVEVDIVPLFLPEDLE